MRRVRPILLTAALLGCTAASDQDVPANVPGRPFAIEEVARFSQPWAMAFLPGGRQALITERQGRLRLWTMGGQAVEVGGVPAVSYGGQGGLGDVILDPGFAGNGLVYLSFAEPGEGGTRHAAVGRGRLVTEAGAPRIEGFQVIWRQTPGFEGGGHYGHRLAFSPDGRHLFISSGERQQFTPSQDMGSNGGKIIRLNPDGSVPGDNPFASRGGVAAQVWSLGHRNPLGLAFDSRGRLWEHEMGPRGGDELNLIERGGNYGYATVSNGDHYDGRDIPDHRPGDGFLPPKITWTPVISPSSLIFYSGAMFPGWRGSALISGLSGRAIVRVAFDGASAREAERWDMGQRIRELEQHPDGSVYVLEDERNGSGGRLLRLVPSR
ncbi:PQQ-dependent sugar dehydrogenase [Sphingosinicella sp.]|uniref:PQQ-dependent sugar dehydrogenase n=1 Tax=Sphingosinicella sp. TaxID=1917971 RepID=UPI0040383298